MPERARAVSRRVLLGTVPVFAPAPPRSPYRSMSATLAPIDAAVVAPTIPAGPAPITARSYTLCIVITVLNLFRAISLQAARRLLPVLRETEKEEDLSRANYRVHLPEPKRSLRLFASMRPLLARSRCRTAKSNRERFRHRRAQ